MYWLEEILLEFDQCPVLYKAVCISVWPLSLRDGQFRDHILVGLRYSAPVKEHPASYTTGTGSFLRVKWQ